MNMQALVDELSAQWQRERSQTQMTLGGLIAALEALPPETTVTPGIAYPHSYRGYYSDLAFENRSASTTASELLAACRGAMGKTFTGYKGGDYDMGARTPIWLAEYGCCGQKIKALHGDGRIETTEDTD